MEISEKVKRAYRWAVSPPNEPKLQIETLADALRDMLAIVLKTESWDRAKVSEWSPEDWQSEAHRFLMGEEQ